jgi:peptide/nickel transport system permease protein
VGSYLVRRLTAAIPIFIGVTFITFALVRASAGNYIPGVDENFRLTAEEKDAIRRLLGLDQPVPIQYWNWITGLVHGDMGRALLDGAPVFDLIMSRLPNTLVLNMTAMVIGIVVSIPLGVVSAIRRAGKIDNLLTFFSVLGISVPLFWLGLLGITLFAILFRNWGLPSLPAGGATSAADGGGLPDRIAHLVMPALVLALAYLAVWSRYVRSSMVEVLSQDYVRTARAKGLSERVVTYIHALRNATIPLVTLIGLQLPSLVGGSAIVEIVFNWPGLGRLALERALVFDQAVILGITTITSLLVIAGALLADVAAAYLDPRIRLG